MHRAVARAAILVSVAVMASSCADRPVQDLPQQGPTSAASSDTGVDSLTVTCTREGGTELSATQVEAQADGVHVHVENRAGEPASLNGLGYDADPGSSDIVTSTPPGSVDVACWPFSGHEGPEPETTSLEILDPNAYFVSSELECAGNRSWGQVNDFIYGATGTQGEPVDIARDRIRGLEPGDELIPTGYRDREDTASVAVVRGGSTIAVASFQRAEDGGWLLGGGSGCDETDIRF